MLSTDRSDFEHRLRVLFAGLDKPLGEAKEEAFWKGLTNMSLIEFGRCCDLVLEELEDGDKRREYVKSFTPGEIWGAKRRLRNRIAAAIDKQTYAEPAHWFGDSWDSRGNELLLGYIGDQARAGVSYCCEETRSCRRSASSPSDETRALTAPLIAYKRAWSQDMRESADALNCVPMAIQHATFMDCMRRAEVEIAEVRGWYAQRRDQERAA